MVATYESAEVDREGDASDDPGARRTEIDGGVALGPFPAPVDAPAPPP